MPLTTRIMICPLPFHLVWTTILLDKCYTAFTLGILNCFTLIHYTYLVNFGLIESIADVVVVSCCMAVSLFHVMAIVGGELLENHIGGSAMVTRGDS